MVALSDFALNVRDVRQRIHSIGRAATVLLTCIQAENGRADVASARLVVPGHEQAMDLFEDLHERHLG